MALFSFFNKKKEPPMAQPHAGWPWKLELSGHPNQPLSWDILVSQLRKLNLEDEDSFLILEQRDPQNSKEYWFIQSALAKMGPHQGEYIIGIGWSAPGHNQLWEKYVPRVEQVIDCFDAAYRRGRVDFTGFEDQSDLLP